MLNKIKETAEYILSQVNSRPKIAIILGSGLGKIADSIKVEKEIEYKDIPNFPHTTVIGHEGKLIIGKIADKDVIALKGRFHYYEGYSMSEVVFPVRVFRLMGVEKLIVSNASGGVNPNFQIGELMLITDHINLMGVNPLIGPNIEELGTRFPDMSEAYSTQMIEKAENIAAKHNIKYSKGVYAAVTGPNLETPAEYFYIRYTGADAIGMSTIPEVIAAVHCGLECFGVSIITDLGVDGKIEKTTHQMVIDAANSRANDLIILITELLRD